MLLWTEALRNAGASLERFTFPPIPTIGESLNACFYPANIRRNRARGRAADGDLLGHAAVDVLRL